MKDEASVAFCRLEMPLLSGADRVGTDLGVGNRAGWGRTCSRKQTRVGQNLQSEADPGGDRPGILKQTRLSEADPVVRSRPVERKPLIQNSIK